MQKDMTAGDVHVATTGKPKRKKVRPPVVKHEWAGQMAITKMDAEQRLVFGWASISCLDGKELIDKQGDIVPVQEIEKAAYDFVLYSREQGDMHSQIGVGRLVESCVFTPEKERVGLVAKNERGEKIYGWFVGFKVESDEVWKAHREGRRPEFSIGGRAASAEV